MNLWLKLLLVVPIAVVVVELNNSDRSADRCYIARRPDDGAGSPGCHA
jgi:hypothetical protein